MMIFHMREHLLFILCVCVCLRSQICKYIHYTEDVQAYIYICIQIYMRVYYKNNYDDDDYYFLFTFFFKTV